MKISVLEFWSKSLHQIHSEWWVLISVDLFFCFRTLDPIWTNFRTLYCAWIGVKTSFLFSFLVERETNHLYRLWKLSGMWSWSPVSYGDPVFTLATHSKYQIFISLWQGRIGEFLSLVKKQHRANFFRGKWLTTMASYKGSSACSHWRGCAKSGM